MNFGTRKTETITIINATIQQTITPINQSIIRKLLQCSTSASITLNNAMHYFCRQHIYDLCSNSVTVISEIKYLVTLVYFNQRNRGM